jgi:hypothetical protein
MSQAWPDSRAFWQDKQVIVTGGSGFLGAFVVDKLRERGAAEVIVPRQADYDLRDITAIRKLFADVHNSQFSVHNSQLVVIHLAAHVGGIGANRAKPAKFFGACPELTEGTIFRYAQDRPDDGRTVDARGLAHGGGEVRCYRHGLRLSQSFDKLRTGFTPTPFHEGDLWNDYLPIPFSIRTPSPTSSRRVANVTYPTPSNKRRKLGKGNVRVAG